MTNGIVRAHIKMRNGLLGRQRLKREHQADGYLPHRIYVRAKMAVIFQLCSKNARQYTGASMKIAGGKFQVVPVAIRSLVVTLLTMFASRSPAFSLLGPFANWMYATNGYHMEYDIGGPMNINEGYRWNVPVVTYGFDKSFIDYFGSNGVAAVEEAIQIINDLPPASSIVLSNYPIGTLNQNFLAAGQGLYDLKSMTLAVIFEQLGLTQPVRNIFDIRQWAPELIPPDPPAYCFEPCFAWAIPNFIIERNFDPETLASTKFVNGTLYSGYILYDSNQLTDVLEFPVDLLPDTAVGEALNPWEAPLQLGCFYRGLTRDDVGGIRFLLNKTNVNYENLLPSVYSDRDEIGPRINGAWRPGIGKITFKPHLARKNGRFDTIQIEFTDSYIRNGAILQQRLRRIVHQPDFLFSAADINGGPFFVTTGTTNWENNAAANGDTNNCGPGVIRPPITITFHKLGTVVMNGDNFPPTESLQNWGSFDGSTNLPVVYPVLTGQNTNQCTVHLYLPGQTSPTNYAVWHLNVPVGQAVALQINTNGTDWTTLTTVTNTGGVVEWYYAGSLTPLPGFDVVPAP